MRGFLLILLSLFSVTAFAATEIRTVSAEATGIDREQAIYNALGEAVRQVRGAQISASRQVQSALTRISQRTDDGRTSSTEIVSGSKSETRVAASGLISGYRILSVSNSGSGGGKLARLEVDVPVYKAPGSSAQDSRWRMAVYPVETARSRYTVDQHSLSAEEVSRRLTHSISNALIQSRRFAVLARDNESAIFEERHRVAGKNVPVAEKAMLGNTLGAEYLVVARLSDLSLGSEQKTSSLTGEKVDVATGAAVLELRIVIPATGGIVWSQTLNATSAALGLQLDGSGHSAQKVFDQIGREVALRVIDAVWPPLVEKQQGGELVINMGGSLMVPGETWEVFVHGDAVRNSHTDIGLGREERRVATARITRSSPKIAYARVIDGNVKGSGHVLRRRVHTSSKESAAEMVRGTRKRVCLPIDPC